LYNAPRNGAVFADEYAADKAAAAADERELADSKA
jgi:hypothetical protein